MLSFLGFDFSKVSPSEGKRMSERGHSELAGFSVSQRRNDAVSLYTNVANNISV